MCDPAGWFGKSDTALLYTAGWCTQSWARKVVASRNHSAAGAQEGAAARAAEITVAPTLE